MAAKAFLLKFNSVVPVSADGTLRLNYDVNYIDFNGFLSKQTTLETDVLITDTQAQIQGKLGNDIVAQGAALGFTVPALQTVLPTFSKV